MYSCKNLYDTLAVIEPSIRIFPTGTTPWQIDDHVAIAITPLQPHRLGRSAQVVWISTIQLGEGGAEVSIVSKVCLTNSICLQFYIRLICAAEFVVQFIKISQLAVLVRSNLTQSGKTWCFFKAESFLQNCVINNNIK